MIRELALRRFDDPAQSMSKSPESEQYFQVLRSNGAPTELLRLPGCSHRGAWNGSVAARDAQNEALIGWFRRYLG